MALNKASGWLGSILSRSDPGCMQTKSVKLGGVLTVLEGAVDDPYFQSIEGQAAALDGLAALIERQVPRNS